jgi:cystathionine gamma-lyase
VADLEEGRHGVAFASGMAALDTLAKLLSAGDHVVSGEGIYGGSFRLFDQVFSRLGIRFTFVDSSDPEAIAAAIEPGTRLVHVETPTNPMMRVTDLRVVADITRRAGVLLSVDNTFASPFNQRPLTHGADVVLHSTTKYLNGHSDVIGGLLVVNDDDLHERIRFLQNAAGAVPGPWDCWLTLRGTKTLHLRMRAHNENGMRVAEWLEGQEGVERVNYPGLPSHSQHEVARRQMDGFGGMISIELGSAARARRFVESVRVFALAESLGGVESLIGVPAMMTHASVPLERRQRLGVTDGLVRLSCGVEDVADLLADLDGALSAARKA